jgi:ATP-grasp domain, R2K clade family 3
MHVKWLFEKDVFLDGNSERLVEMVRRRGMECKTIRYADGDEVHVFNESDRVVVYGSIGFVRNLICKKRWQPTAWFDENVLCCHHYYSYWGSHLLQHNFRFLTLGELQRQAATLYSEVGVDGRLFIRPDDNLKSFAGSVVLREKFDRWLKQNVSCYDLPASLLCLVSTPQEILGEWRLVIAERQVLTASAYIAENRTGSIAAVPQEVLATAGRILAHASFDPFPIYVMDIAQTANGFFLMEIGSLNCASLYACDLDKVVDVASRLAG